MGEQDGRNVRLLGTAFGHGTGRECAQRCQQQRQKKCGKATEFHTVPPDLQKQRVRKDSLLISDCQPYSPIIRVTVRPVNKPAYRSSPVRSAKVSRRTAS